MTCLYQSMLPIRKKTIRRNKFYLKLKYFNVVLFLQTTIYDYIQYDLIKRLTRNYTMGQSIQVPDHCQFHQRIYAQLLPLQIPKAPKAA